MAYYLIKCDRVTVGPSGRTEKVYIAVKSGVREKALDFDKIPLTLLGEFPSKKQAQKEIAEREARQLEGLKTMLRYPWLFYP